MADNKIPVLTEVYQPKKEAKPSRKENASVEVTPELIAKVAAEIRPKIEEEIRQALQIQLQYLAKEETQSQAKTFVQAEIETKLQDSLTQARERMAAESQNLISRAVSELDVGREALEKIRQTNMTESKSMIEKVYADLDAKRREFDASGKAAVDQARNFLDKAKADLKTDLPMMYQKSIELAQVNLSEKFAGIEKEAQAKFETVLAESVQTITNSSILNFNSQLESLHSAKTAEITKRLQQEIAAFQKEAAANNELLVKTHADLSQSLHDFFETTSKAMEVDFSKRYQEYQRELLAEQQKKIEHESAELMRVISQRIEEGTQEQLAAIETQSGTMQQERLAQLREQFHAETTEIYNAVAAEIKTTFSEQMTAKGNEIRQALLAQMSGELPSVQEVLRKNIQQLVTQSMADFEAQVRAELSDEIKSLLLSVKFVLPS